jgi:L-lactate utilization protein LutB
LDFNLDVLKNNLSKRGFDAVVRDSLQDAADFVAETFPVDGGTVVGMGNSLTLDALGVKKLWEGRVAAIYRHTPDSSEIETKRALLADIYLTSANAVSLDGQIVNIDGTGNRTAATCYGPKRVVYVIGKNKIAPSLEDAIRRAKNTAAVQNAKRYNRKTPCAITGKCEDCLSPDCLCAVMTIHRKQPLGAKITVILVDECAGF